MKIQMPVTRHKYCVQWPVASSKRFPLTRAVDSCLTWTRWTQRYGLAPNC
ncbi:hypothetical protein MCC10078_0597 [Bifidobacterium longum subsp. longum]|nr:hypothetical protein MCC10078_0597 [Bifidobacterium longum subsp. longum]